MPDAFHLNCLKSSIGFYVLANQLKITLIHPSNVSVNTSDFAVVHMTTTVINYLQSLMVPWLMVL